VPSALFKRVISDVKVKLSYCRPGQVLRAPGRWFSQNFYKISTWRW